MSIRQHRRAGKLFPVRRILLPLVAAFILLVGKDLSLDAHTALFGQRQIQLYAPYMGTQTITLPPVLLVAHNAGNQQETAGRALRHGSPAIEVDVRSFRGDLYATHSAPASWLPSAAYQAPRLHEAWAWTRDARVLKIDLKATSASALDDLTGFLNRNIDGRQIIIVSSDPEALRVIADDAPHTVRLLSLETHRSLSQFIDSSEWSSDIDGVSVPAWLLDAETISWLKEHDLLIDVWTVNDIDRLITLASQRVDSVTTDNLAFFELASDPS